MANPKSAIKDNDPILKTLTDFTSKENWDNFFSIRGTQDSFEWYSEWQYLKSPLLSQLSDFPSSSNPIQILIPGCGNSKLSENLFDSGFHGITNIDFSKVVIGDMLRRNIRERSAMRWRVMDMTKMQFTDDTFDAIVDKGGLDALMEPELGSKLGTQYLSEVKRVLKPQGKFVCLTLAESHVLALLLSKFRYGWKMVVHAIPNKRSNRKSFRTFMVVVEKEMSSQLHQIMCSFDISSLDCDINQRGGLIEALDRENRTRGECAPGADILYSLEDLKLGAGGDLKELSPGRRLQLTLGEDGQSLLSYKAVLLDAQQQSDDFTFHCGVFLVPKTRSHEWLFASEEGQWLIVESSNAARLIMVLLDSRHSDVSMDDIQKDLSPLVRGLAPGKLDDGPQIPFMMANDGIKQRNVVHQVNSTTTGDIIVEDVIYENVEGPPSDNTLSKDMTFRRLTFQRSLGLVQSEALLLTGEESSQASVVDETDQKKPNPMSKSKKKTSHKKRSSPLPLVDESKNSKKVDHQYLASSYHGGIISGLTLVSTHLQDMASSGRTAKTVIIGLGAGLLPMYLRACIPCLDIEVVELDPLVAKLAKDFFGFLEDKQLKAYVSDGIKFVREITNTTNENEKNKIDVLIIDVDSSDTSSGLSCPHPDFVEESFLVSVKESLSEKGLFVINLVTRSPAITESVVSRIKTVFNRLYCLQLEEDVNMVLFALPTDSSTIDDCSELEKLLKLIPPERSQTIIDTVKKIKCLK
ncbi:hypothetical protein ACHQM5_027966 [Ranunculus cassubicifolius]